jgi:hypothetical protein
LYSDVVPRKKKPECRAGKHPEGVRRTLASIGRSAESVKFLPLRGRQADGAVLLDAKTGAPLDILLVDPW